MLALTATRVVVTFVQSGHVSACLPNMDLLVQGPQESEMALMYWPSTPICTLFSHLAWTHTAGACTPTGPGAQIHRTR